LSKIELRILRKLVALIKNKNALFLLKNCKHRRALLFPDSQPPNDGGEAPRPPHQPHFSHDKFLATRLLFATYGTLTQNLSDQVVHE